MGGDESLEFEVVRFIWFLLGCSMKFLYGELEIESSFLQVDDLTQLLIGGRVDQRPIQELLIQHFCPGNVSEDPERLIERTVTLC